MPVDKVLARMIRKLQAGVHPGDLLEMMAKLDERQQKELLERLPDAEAAAIVQEMEEHARVALVHQLDRQKVSAILREMNADNAVDLLGDLPEKESRELLSLLEDEAAKYRGLLRYPGDSAGGIMTTDYISLPGDLPVEEAIHRLREVAPRAEIIYYAYVVDADSRLIGVLSLRDLIAASDGTLLREIMRCNVITVDTATDQEEVARIVSKYDLLAVPVTAADGRLLGIITVDDVLDVIEQEASEDMYKLAGAGDVERVSLLEAPVWEMVRHRLPWLLICLAGGIFSGSIIDVFESTLEAIFVLAVFIPVIMDMGGNVGTQSSTIFVRGIATGEIRPGDVWRYLFRELRIGLMMGFLTGILIAVVAYIWQGSLVLGLVVGISLGATVLLGALLGTLVPLLCNMVRIDPAITSGPFVTTIKDVTGLLIYFGIATLFLSYLR